MGVGASNPAQDPTDENLDHGRSVKNVAAGRYLIPRSSFVTVVFVDQSHCLTPCCGSTADERAAVICRSETSPRGRPLSSTTTAASQFVFVKPAAASSSVVPVFSLGSEPVSHRWE